MLCRNGRAMQVLSQETFWLCVQRPCLLAAQCRRSRQHDNRHCARSCRYAKLLQCAKKKHTQSLHGWPVPQTDPCTQWTHTSTSQVWQQQQCNRLAHSRTMFKPRDMCHRSMQMSQLASQYLSEAPGSIACLRSQTWTEPHAQAVMLEQFAGGSQQSLGQGAGGTGWSGGLGHASLLLPQMPWLP